MIVASFLAIENSFVKKGVQDRHQENCKLLNIYTAISLDRTLADTVQRAISSSTGAFLLVYF